MLDVFLCYPPADRDIATAIAARLERGAEAKVWLEECGSHGANTVAASWDGGLSSDAILLLLSPDAVPKRFGREDWQALLEHLEGNTPPPVGAVLLGGCPYPRLLERRHFFRWGDGAQQTLRAIERWIAGLHPQSESPSFIPARLPWFEGRRAELEMMWETLVDEAGTLVLTNAAPAGGKTSLAQQFVHAAGSHFLDTLWVPCGGRSRVSIAGELASHLGVSLEGAAGDAFARLGSVIQNHRVLLVLDDVTSDIGFATARARDLAAETECALRWALRADWDLATRLGAGAVSFLKAEARWPEVAAICTQLRDAAIERGDSTVAENYAWELSWIQDEGGGIRRLPAMVDQLAFEFS